MPTLASLGLITKSWTKPTADTDLARHFGPERLHVMWELAPSTPATEARWAELTKEGVNGGTMAAIAREKRSTDDAAALEEKYAKFARGELVPTAREMAAWPGRPAGFTTHLERLHLNTRRKRARDGKEVRRAELVAEQKAAADAAKEALEAQP
jgi:hypothetical protein